MTLSPGTLLNDRYRIVAILGQGGMGAVYQAEDEHLGIKVAVKENLYLSDEYTRQFQREANILASMRHPSLPRVGDYFSIVAQGQYLIMDFIEGEDLRQRIERINTLPAREVTLIGIMICDALSYLHTCKPPIVHRDIKPGNIKITPEGQIALVDFGLAKIMVGSQATITGARAMTPGYSPPEQYGTARTDPRSDVYSLGATLYAALTGVIPEDGLARATGKASLTPIRQVIQNADRRLSAAIEKALEVEPDNRFQTAEEFEKVLVEAGNISPATQQRMLISPPPGYAIEDDGPIEETPVPPKSKSRPRYENSSRPRKRSRVPTFLLFLILVVAAILGVYTFQPNIPAVLAQRLSMIPGIQPSPLPLLTESTQTFTPEATDVSPSSTPDLPTVTATQSQSEPVMSATKPTQTQAATYTPVTATETPAVTATLAGTPLGGEPGQIAFVSDRTNLMQIWLMDQDGNNERQLTNMPEGACQPAWSFDGMQIAFISPCSDRQEESYAGANIYTMNIDGTNVQKLEIGKGDGFDPAWAPDGKKIAFTSTRTGTMHIFLLNLEDLSMQELSDTRYPDFQPSWRPPEGKQLAFIRKTPYDHIWIMSDQGMTQFRFSLEGNINDLWPRWSSDGELITFTHSTIEPSVPWMVYQKYENRTFGPEYRIPPLGAEDIGPGSMPSLSPDMQWIVYESWPDGRNHDVFRVSFEGKDRVRLTTDPGNDFSPVWRPKTP